MKVLTVATLFSMVTVYSFAVHAQKSVIKADLNIAGRRAAEVNELDYTPWPVGAGAPDKQTIRGVTIVFSATGGSGGFTGTYYKRSLQPPYFARLAGDGLVWKGAQGGGVEMRISGLPQGKHTLLTFHNSLGVKADKAGPVDIYVDGVKRVSQLEPSERVLDNTDCATAYLNLEASAGKEVVVLFKSVTGAPLVINGFELNTADSKATARHPLPFNGDEHADADNSTLLLEWGKAANAVAHELYWGADSALVAAATNTSAGYAGKIKDTCYRMKNLLSSNTYYWRVDEVAADGTVSLGPVWYFRPRQLAFPGAEGYGRFARGGRGGKVVEVTNLNDDGPGSLREALTNDIGPRTVVFTVSGIILLQSRLVSNQRYVTIAGQTAPGKGICIARAPLGIVGDDNIARFLRVRLGAGPTYDGMGLTGADHSIVDHCSISWTIDEAFSSRGANNITLQRTLISEALNEAGHDKKPVGNRHGFAATIGGNIGSFHHNLLAHCEGRNWSLGGGLDGDGYYSGEMDITNNVVYNWSGRTTDGGTKEVNFVNNYYKPGPASKKFVAFTADHEGVGLGTQRCYFSGNVMPGYFDENNQEAGRHVTFTHGDTSSYPSYVNAPFFPSYVTTETAGEAYKNVLSDVGCTAPVFDEHDNRIARETMEGSYTYKGSKTGKPGLPDTHEDVGGWENYPEVHRAGGFDTDHDGLPDWWEQLHGTNLHSAPGNFEDANADKDGDGFTSLDDYLNWLAAPHFTAAAGKALSIDLKQLSRGYVKKCTYLVSEVVNGEVKLSGDGVVSFIPSKDGLASFWFTVKDVDGSVFKREVKLVALSDVAL